MLKNLQKRRKLGGQQKKKKRQRKLCVLKRQRKRLQSKVGSRESPLVLDLLRLLLQLSRAFLGFPLQIVKQLPLPRQQNLLLLKVPQ